MAPRQTPSTLAEDRERFQELVHNLGLKQPHNGIAHSGEEAFEIAADVTYPLVIRPSYVLGGRAMEIVRDHAQLERYINEAVVVSGDSPVLLDSYLSGAVEVDVDCLCDGENTHVAGIMQHIEEAGVHSGDSACSLPPYSLSARHHRLNSKQPNEHCPEPRSRWPDEHPIRSQKWREFILIEVNPRAIRTVPFVAKAVRSPIAAIAARIMAGEPLSNFPLRPPYAAAKDPMDVMPLGDPFTLADPNTPWFSVKEAVLPFNRFPGVDTILGPEMRSTGEVMGWARSFPRAFYKAQLGAGTVLPTEGLVFLSIRDADKTPAMLEAAQLLTKLGFSLIATKGTAKFLTDAGMTVENVNKGYEGGLTIVDRLKDGHIALVFNSTEGSAAVEDSRSMRAVTLNDKIPYYTTAAAAQAAVMAMVDRVDSDIKVRALQG